MAKNKLNVLHTYVTMSLPILRLLEEYLDFRHPVRHVYGHDLVWDRFEKLAKDFNLVFKELFKTVKNFLNFLETIIQATQKGTQLRKLP